MVVGKWKKVLASEKLQRSSQTVSVIGSRAYIYGGELRPREPVDSDVHAIDLTSDGAVGDALSTIPGSSSSGPSPRVGSASTVLHGQLYIFSGRGGVAMSPIEEHGSLWVFDPKDKSWSRIAPKDETKPYPQGRSYHAVTDDGKDTIFVHAGCPEKGRLSDLWAFSLSDRAWKQLASGPDPARGGPSIAFFDGKLFRLNGFDGKTEQGGSLDIYDIGTDTWTTVKYTADGVAGPSARSVSCLLALDISGRPSLVTMFGEHDPSNLGHQGAGKMLDDVWMWDIQSQNWTKLAITGATFPPARGWFDAGVYQTTPNPSIVVQGGLAESNERLDDLFLLEFES